jgi:alpha-galactosidase
MNDVSDSKWTLLLHYFTRILLRRACLPALALAISASHIAAQTASSSIRYESTSREFRIDAAETSYIFGVNDDGQLQALYWGKRLGAEDQLAKPKALSGSGFDVSTSLTSQEFVAWGGGLVTEPDLKVTFPDGNRDLVLKYVSHRIEGNTLSIEMKDVSREVYVTLEYRADAETGILRRCATIENRTETPLTIEQVAAGTWNLPRADDYRLRYLTGRWAGEWNVQEQPIHPGKTLIESRRGTTGAQNNPWFAIDHSGSTEENGSVWFGALGWSGS